jgi:hypothetical protein
MVTVDVTSLGFRQDDLPRLAMILGDERLSLTVEDGVSLLTWAVGSEEDPELVAASRRAALLDAAEAVVRMRPKVRTGLTRVEFMLRFTAQERIAIRASADPLVADFMELMRMSESIELEHPATVMGLQYLEALGLLGEGRAGEILAS